MEVRVEYPEFLRNKADPESQDREDQEQENDEQENDEQEKDEPDNKDLFYDIDPEAIVPETAGSLRKRLAAELGLYIEAFRLKTKKTGTVLKDSTKLTKEMEDTEEMKPPLSSESEGDGEKGSLEEEEESSEKSGEEEESSEKSGEDEATTEKEGKKSQDSEGEMKRQNRQMEFLIKLFEKSSKRMSNKDEEEEQSVSKSHVFSNLRNEIMTVLRMTRDTSRLEMTGDRVPRDYVLHLEIEQAWPIYIITANDTPEALPCLATDTVRSMMERAADRFGCPLDNFVLRKDGENGPVIQPDADVTLDALGIAQDAQFYASRTGVKKITVMFSFAACARIEVNMESPVRKMRKRIISVAPDLKYVKFNMLYNGVFLQQHGRGEGPNLGDVIMGSSILRLVMEIDFSLDPKEDPNPDLILTHIEDPEPKPEGSSVNANNQRDNKEKEGQKLTSSDDSLETGNNDLRLFFDVNKRVVKHFTLLVECRTVDPEDGKDKNQREKPSRNAAEYEAPITLKGLTAKTRLMEVRRKIAEISNEHVFYTILYKNGTPFEAMDDNKTLDELDLVTKDGNGKCIFKEPCKRIKIVYTQRKSIGVENPKTVEVTLKLAGQGTSFGRLAELLHREYREKIDLKVDDMVFEVNGFIVTHDCLFSDYGKDGIDEDQVINIIPPFRVRLWHKCHVYDNDRMWPHTFTYELKDWIFKSTGVRPAQQVLLSAADDAGNTPIDTKHTTIGECGFVPGYEIELFEQGDLPPRLDQIRGQYGVAENDPFKNFVKSDDIQDDEDDEDYQDN